MSVRVPRDSCTCLQLKGHGCSADYPAVPLQLTQWRLAIGAEKIPKGSVQAPHYTVKPRPEAHMDMILFEVFLKNVHLIPQEQIVQ